MFAELLKKAMFELNLNQVKVSELTGCSRAAISQYVSGKNEPSQQKKMEIAVALGLPEDYFLQLDPEPKIAADNVINVPVKVIAKLMKKSDEWVRQGLRDGVFPWGYAVKLTKWSYFISSQKFTEYTGIQIPVKGGVING